MQYLVYLAPGVLSFAAALVLWFGWPRASRYRSPSSYRSGLVLVAAGLIGVWLVPVCLYVMGGRLGTELQGLLYLLAFFVSCGIIAGGLDTIRRANNTPSDDFWDSL